MTAKQMLFQLTITIPSRLLGEYYSWAGWQTIPHPPSHPKIKLAVPAISQEVQGIYKCPYSASAIGSFVLSKC